MKRRRGKERDSHEVAVPPRDEQLTQLFVTFGRPAILALATALLVSTPLIASESIVSDASGASWHMIWLALAFVSLAGSTLIVPHTQRWSWADLCVIALVAWHVLSASLCDGNQRSAWNAAWQWATYGALAVVLRQQLHMGKETRAMIAVMLALALAVSLHAYYQYGYSQPQMRAQFEKDPDGILQQMGIPTDHDSPIRASAVNRIQSVEPTGEFALTNSLAGYLLPWLLVALAIAFWSVQRDGLVMNIAAALVIALLIFGVLVLTKSRTAWLAAVIGCGLILLYCRRSGWQLDWRWPMGLAAVAVVIGLGAVAVNGLDAEVLSESPKSVLYRIEYWRATARLIADEPIFGIGPGNFKERYAQYKLPEASETVSDPHNFLLEIWSTAGTPALLALLLLGGATVWRFSRLPREAVQEAVDASAIDNTLADLATYGICAGAVLGLLLAGILGFVAEDPLLTTKSDSLLQSSDAALGIPIIWLAAVPAYAFCYFLLRDWVERGELPRAAVVCALVAILVNLLAAGAAIYPGVVNAAWLLWAIAMQKGPSSAVSADEIVLGVPQTRALNWGLAILFVGALFGCAYTEYWPVLNSRGLLFDAAAERGSYEAATQAYDRAIAADPWSPDVKRAKAEFCYDVWQYGKTIPKYWTPFLQAQEAYERSTPYHYVQHEQRGKWLLSAGRRVRNPEYITEAAKAYEAAVERFPNSGFLHAQLAYVYHALGRSAEASQEAEEAGRLDALCPHLEQKLERRKLYDVQWTSDAQQRPTSKEVGPNALEFVNQLRKPATEAPQP